MPTSPCAEAGILDGAAGLLRKAQHGQAGADGGRGAGAAAAGQEIGRRGVQRPARPSCHWRGCRWLAEHGHVGLAEDHGIGRPHAGDHGAVCRRHQIDAAGLAVEERPSGGGGKPHHVHRVLDHHGNAGQRPERLTSRAATVDGAGGLQRIGIEKHDGVVGRIVEGDAVEKGLGQRLGGDRAAREGGLCLFDGQFHEVDRGGRRGGWGIVHVRDSVDMRMTMQDARRGRWFLNRARVDPCGSRPVVPAPHSASRTAWRQAWAAGNSRGGAACPATSAGSWR